jgi:radical SAM protein
VVVFAYSEIRRGAMYGNINLNFDERPFVAAWEITQACDVACVHCRACAQPSRNASELSTAEAKRLIDEIAAMQVPVFVLTGGDPLKRSDTFELVKYASDRKVRTSLVPSATPLLTRESIVRLKECGLARLAVSLDGPTAAIHDAFRGVPGSNDWTVRAVRWAREIDLPVQINTTITRHNVGMIEELVALIGSLDITLWSVFFLVPAGHGPDIDLITAEEFEKVFERLHATSQRVLFDIKCNEAQHYRRYLLQRRIEARRLGQQPAQTYNRIPQFSQIPVGMETPDGNGRAPSSINDGKGFVFISHLGEVYPSGFLPVSGGNVRQQSLAQIYRNSEVFRALRDSKNLQGKCGVCEYHEICGGSRARAFVMTGDMFAEEPCCLYEPKCQANTNEEPARASA